MFRLTYALDLFSSPDPAELALSQGVLNVMLECLVRINEAWLRAHPETPDLFDSGVYYQEEPPGQEDWCDIPTALKMRAIDCEDIACWCVAELRVRYGIPAQVYFTHQVRKEGGDLYHILVWIPPCPQYPNGRTVDPSADLGMR